MSTSFGMRQCQDVEMQPPAKRRKKTPSCPTAALRPLKGLKSFAVVVAAKVQAAKGPTSYSDVADLLVEETLAKLEYTIAQADKSFQSYCQSQIPVSRDINSAPTRTHSPSKTDRNGISIFAVQRSADRGNSQDAARAENRTQVDPGTYCQHVRDTGSSSDARGAMNPLLKVLPTSPITTSPSQQLVHNPYCSIKHLASEYDAAYEEKNIRRRVYDALNVLYAMGLISRTGKKGIVWRGIQGFLEATHSVQQSLQICSIPNPHPAASCSDGQSRSNAGTNLCPKLISLQSQVAFKRAAVDTLKARTQKMRERVEALRLLISRNLSAADGALVSGGLLHDGADLSFSASNSPDKVQLPFALLAVGKLVKVAVEIQDDHSAISFTIDGPFSFIEGYDVAGAIFSLPNPSRSIVARTASKVRNEYSGDEQVSLKRFKKFCFVPEMLSCFRAQHDGYKRHCCNSSSRCKCNPLHPSGELYIDPESSFHMESRLLVHSSAGHPSSDNNVKSSIQSTNRFCSDSPSGYTFYPGIRERKSLPMSPGLCIVKSSSNDHRRAVTEIASSCPGVCNDRNEFLDISAQSPQYFESLPSILTASQNQSFSYAGMDIQ